MDAGLFASTVLLVSGFALLLVLKHGNVITWTALVLSLCGSTIIYASIGVGFSAIDTRVS